MRKRLSDFEKAKQWLSEFMNSEVLKESLKAILSNPIPLVILLDLAVIEWKSSIDIERHRVRDRYMQDILNDKKVALDHLDGAIKAFLGLTSASEILKLGISSGALKRLINP